MGEREGEREEGGREEGGAREGGARVKKSGRARMRAREK